MGRTNSGSSFSVSTGCGLGREGTQSLERSCLNATALDVGRNLDTEKVQQCGKQVDAAEQFVVDLCAAGEASRGRPDDQRDAGPAS